MDKLRDIYIRESGRSISPTNTAKDELMDILDHPFMLRDRSRQLNQYESRIALVLIESKEDIDLAFLLTNRHKIIREAVKERMAKKTHISG